MPAICFSYEDDGSASTRNRDLAPPRLRDPRTMPHACFSYPADATQPTPPGLRRMPLICFSYPIMCFSYPGDLPPRTGNRDVAEPGPNDLRRMPNTLCFRY
jgi:hypothetical protein